MISNINAEINRHQFPIGSVVYFVEMNKLGQYRVKFGIVEENYMTEIAVQLYEQKDTRHVNGIPIKEFPNITKWYKLPKHWCWDTKLFEITMDAPPAEMLHLKMNRVDDIFKAIDLGYLVKVQENEHCTIESEIDMKYGYRIRKRSPSYGEHHPYYISLPLYKAYKTYEDAKKWIEEYEKECKRISELSDYDWSVEQIDRHLDRMENIFQLTKEKKQEYRDFLLSHDDVENIEARIFNGHLEWKYCKNKTWMTINF